MKTLEREFQVKLDSENLSFDGKVYWMLFINTASSLVNLESGGDGFLEAGLLYKKLEQSDLGKKVLDHMKDVGYTQAHLAWTYRQMLYKLFALIFGEKKQSISSRQLKERGFDDTKEPDFSNYLELL